MIKKSTIVIFIFSMIVLFSFNGDLFAQKIKAKVEITIENLPLENQEKLANFKQIMEDYLNNYDWTTNEIDVEIPITMQIFFRSAAASSFEDSYGIHILISDNSDVQYFDKRCRMEYQQGEVVQHHDNNWDSLTSLIDFYVNILLGEQLDKFGRFMGTPYFEKAKIIAEQAKFGMGRFIEGWDIRNTLIQELLSDNNKKFREMKDFYYYGIFFINEDPKKARMYCSAAIDMIEEIMEQDPKNEKCTKFLSAHHIELIDLFKDSNNKNLFEKLIKLDPDHAEIYQEYL